jgi:putative hemolysin
MAPHSPLNPPPGNPTDPVTIGYSLRLATEPADVRAAQALRFAVFNLELNEGLPSAFQTGLDADPFDEVCDHLLVVAQPAAEVVGTYRLQTGAAAAAHRGYYSAQEFDFTPFESRRHEILELGRACVHRDHRSLAVLSLLWKGIAAYARKHQVRYLIGCSSAPTTDPEVGARLYADLSRRHLASPEWRTSPLTALACPLERQVAAPVKIPRLLAAYLSIGACICGPPALDREFKTVDFLTLADLQALPSRVEDRYLGGVTL